MTIVEYNYICQLIEAMKKIQIEQKPNDSSNKSENNKNN